MHSQQNSSVRSRGFGSPTNTLLQAAAYYFIGFPGSIFSKNCNIRGCSLMGNKSHTGRNRLAIGLFVTEQWCDITIL
jgi:hypothetical protein